MAGADLRPRAARWSGTPSTTGTCSSSARRSLPAMPGGSSAMPGPALCLGGRCRPEVLAAVPRAAAAARPAGCQGPPGCARGGRWPSPASSPPSTCRSCSPHRTAGGRRTRSSRTGQRTSPPTASGSGASRTSRPTSSTCWSRCCCCVGIAVACAVGLAARAGARGRSRSCRSAARCSCLFMLTNKAHSPQYALWLLPFFCLIRLRWGWWVGYLAIDAVMYVGLFRWYCRRGPARRSALPGGHHRRLGPGGDARAAVRRDAPFGDGATRQPMSEADSERVPEPALSP